MSGSVPLRYDVLPFGQEVAPHILLLLRVELGPLGHLFEDGVQFRLAVFAHVLQPVAPSALGGENLVACEQCGRVGFGPSFLCNEQFCLCWNRDRELRQLVVGGCRHEEHDYTGHDFCLLVGDHEVFTEVRFWTLRGSGRIPFPSGSLRRFSAPVCRIASKLLSGWADREFSIHPLSRGAFLFQSGSAVSHRVTSQVSAERTLSGSTRQSRGSCGSGYDFPELL